jgi:CheY-like chemotaxis protein
MRPRKIILCIDSSERALAVRSFLLETRGFRVVAASSAQQAMEILTTQHVDLVLAELRMPHLDGDSLIGQLKQLMPELPMILTSDTVRTGERSHQADVFLGKGNSSPAELIERIRVMSARKRGPRKAQQSAPSPAQMLIPGIPVQQAS